MNKKSLAIGLLSIVLAITIKFMMSGTVKPTKNSEYASTSVMITRYDGRSGGTGVIISSKRNESKILTNAHVCSVLKTGGIVRSDRVKGIVKAYQVSEIHDLCLVTTNTNFFVNTVVAGTQPEPYDDAVVSGHPHLLPNIVTKGHFSQKEAVKVLVGFRPCKIEDITSGGNAEYCQFLGIIPIIKTYEAQIVSATIMPGSSGSAVFNGNGEISGLVFAGSGEFGYGMIVPHEYIVSFFDGELKNIPLIYPSGLTEPAEQESTVDWKSICSKPASTKIKNVCDLISKNLLLLN
jgi:S1-C subfamily serine protease